MRTQKRKIGGFTLIELLVVIAIIAILAAILFPVFAKARDRAKQTTCISNMKQMSVAFLQYFQDNDEMFPPYTTVGIQGSTTPSEVGWTDRLYPYIRSYEIYRCPSNGKSNYAYTMNAMSSSQGARTISRVKSPTKFIHLAECPGSQNTKPITPGVRNPAAGDSDLTTEWGDIKQPGSNQTDGVVYGDRNGNLTAVQHTDAMPIDRVQAMSGAPIGRLYFPGRHSGGNDLMFLDGHVRWFRSWDSTAMTFDPNTQ